MFMKSFFAEIIVNSIKCDAICRFISIQGWMYNLVFAISKFPDLSQYITERTKYRLCWMSLSSTANCFSVRVS